MSIRTRLIWYSLTIIMVTMLCMVAGAAFLNTWQTSRDNQQRTKRAAASIIAEIGSTILEDKTTLSSFAADPIRTMVFRTMTLYADTQSAPREIHKLASSMDATWFAAYFHFLGQGPLQLNQLFSKDLKGTLQLIDEKGKSDRKLISLDINNYQTVRDLSVENLNIDFSAQTAEQDDDVYFAVKNGKLLLTYRKNFINGVDDSIYNIKVGQNLGFFVIQKALKIDLERIGDDFGVYFNFFDREGNGYGRIPLSSDITRQAGFSHNEDNQSRGYDTFVTRVYSDNVFLGYLTASISREDTARKIIETVLVLVAIALLIALFIGIGAYVLVDHGVQPIKQLTLAAHEIAAGNLDHSIKVEGSGEIHQLALNFATMQNSLIKYISKIRELNESLEIKVEQRTEQLNQKSEQLHIVLQQLQERIESGRQIQDLLMPRQMCGEFGPFRYRFFYEPAEKMAGDWFFIWPRGDELTLLIGDVVGKGPQAAVAVAAVITLLNECMEADNTMEEAMCFLNKRLGHLFRHHVNTTVTAATLHINGRVRLYNFASHGWLALSSEWGKLIQERHAALGCSDHVEVPSHLIQGYDGMRLMAFSDGVIDSQRAIFKFIRNVAGKPMGLEELEAAATLMSTQVAYHDDKTLLMIEYVDTFKDFPLPLAS